MTKQEELTKSLIEASDAYYNGKTVLMSDLEFDKKVEELRQMEKESGVILPGSPTRNVGVEVVTELKKARHEQPALSLDKVKYKDRENLVKWLDSEDAVMMWKLDGSTVVLTFDGGTLTSAVTRGNGEEGSVITHNARFFKGVPAKINYTGHLVVRGEAMMANDEFERINAEAGGIYENARNLATATIQMLDANESRKREITFKAFELVTPEPEDYFLDEEKSCIAIYMQDRLIWLEKLGFDVANWECCDSSDILSKIEEWKEDVQNLKYPTDGLVISYNDLLEGWALGSTGHHPRWSMALKWTDETVTTTIRDIEWSVGKTGLITPVAVFDEVRMGLGSNVTRASLHNLSIMQRLCGQDQIVTHGADIIGATAEVYMANMIIPQVGVIKIGDNTTTAEVPKTCPVCGAPTEVVENRDRYGNKVYTLVCTNHEACPAQQIGKLVNTFSKEGLFVKGLSEKKIEFLVNEGYVESVLDFYRLKDQGDEGGVLKKNMYGPHLEDQPGWEIRSVDNLINAIEESRNTTLQRFLYSLNIPLLGNDLSKKLAKYWHNDIEAFRIFVIGVDEGAGRDENYGYNRAMDELTSIDGIGEEKARNIVDWAADLCANADKYKAFDALCGELVFPTISTAADTDNALEGLTFVITGNVHDYKNRDEFKASVEARGGKVAGSVSAKTTALVNNDVTSTSGKNQKAKELGIEIISEDEFISRYGK